MGRIKLAGKHDAITVYDGERSKVYSVESGHVVVDDSHEAAVLSAVAGSELKPEAPAKEK